jgi:hypothetical protein
MLWNCNRIENKLDELFLKSRNKFGGGVGFIIKKQFIVEEIDELNKFNVEIVCIKIKFEKKNVYFITYYNPPTTGIVLKKEVFEYIEKHFENYIICGDFNAKHKSFGCRVNNKNGIILREFLFDSRSILLNKKNQYTFFKNNNQ